MSTAAPAVPPSDDPLDGLTPEQRADMEGWAKRWTDSDELAQRRARRQGLGGVAAAIMSRPGMTVPPVRVRGMLASQALADPHLKAEGDRLYAEADAAAVRARRDLQTANRHAAYLRTRPSKYATASYETLTPEQNPRGLVSSWWARGPRALLLAGSSRTGKTTAAYAICNEAHSKRAWVVATTAVALHTACKPVPRDRDTPPDAYVPSRHDPNAFMRAAMCDLLLLDDLGRETVWPWWRSELHELLDVREREQKRTIVTANTPTDPEAAYNDLLERYGDPLVERIFDGGGIIMFDGPPIRNLVTEW